MALRFSDDPYLLRRLTRCHSCDLHLTCALAAGERVYVCYSCSGGIRFPARDLESRTVTEASRRATIESIAPGCLASALEQLLAMVIVGPGPDDVRYRWRV